MPVAVVTAGAEKGASWLKAIQAVPALASNHGYVAHVAGARHASLLGPRFADAVVRGVEHVLASAGPRFSGNERLASHEPRRRKEPRQGQALNPRL
jgi:hypothetical protein